MKLYRFLSSKYALQALQTGMLKVGRISEFNDPIDCAPCVTDLPPSFDWDPVKYADHIATGLNRELGIICYTTWEGRHEPVVWSHYADCHRGIALGFEIPDSQSLRKVKYSWERPTIEWKELKQAKHFGLIGHDALNTKAKSWEYEHEYRQFVDLSECMPRDGMYFYKFPWEHLVDITLGARCTHDFYSQPSHSPGFEARSG